MRFFAGVVVCLPAYEAPCLVEYTPLNEGDTQFTDIRGGLFQHARWSIVKTNS